VTGFSIFAADEPLRAFESYLGTHPALARYLRDRDWHACTDEILMPFHKELRALQGSLKPLWTHNDFHASNLMWSSNSGNAEVAAIFDFGLANLTNAVHDIATAIERNSINWLALDGDFDSVVHLDQIDALLEGYEQVSPLTGDEAQALVAMLPLVHAEFALSEADYFVGVLASEEKASLAWDGYFLGHTQWFGTDAGRRTLDHLRRWASNRQTTYAYTPDQGGSHVIA
jgi:Ser/Thr protein kinase RdoA (MazF antagonist)